MAIIDEVQRVLSIAQCVPLAGPIFVSPCKAMVSIAQLTAGLAKSVFCGTIALSAVTLTAIGLDLSTLAALSLVGTASGYVGLFNGTRSLIYSYANMCTFGIAGLVCEVTWLHFRTELL